MACFTPPNWLTLLAILVLLTWSPILSNEQDAARLRKFKGSLMNAGELSNWDQSTTPPYNSTTENWKGLICDKDGNVFGLQLENMGLAGTIDTDTLVEVTSLRTLSFFNNNFVGSIPNMQKIRLLRGVYLTNNKFSGETGGDAFSGMTSLRKLELGNNNFIGKIPISLTQLPVLVDLQIQNNKFEGEIPDFEQKYLRVNFSNNRLVGSIPKGLSNQDLNSFAGNNLCGKPLTTCKTSKKLHKKKDQSIKPMEC